MTLWLNHLYILATVDALLRESLLRSSHLLLLLFRFIKLSLACISLALPQANGVQNLKIQASPIVLFQHKRRPAIGIIKYLTYVSRWGTRFGCMF